MTEKKHFEKKMLDDVINDVTRPGSKIREEELFSLGWGPSS